MNMNKTLLLIILTITLIGCSVSDVLIDQSKNGDTQIFQVLGDGEVIIRAITTNKECPNVIWDQLPAQQLKTRAKAANIPLRKKSDEVASNFPITTCEITWPKGVQQATINGQTLRALKLEIQRIVIIADTGCRLKAADNSFQDCNDGNQWPFKKIIQHALKTNPDLVVHVGDIHYRESPCPEGRAGCKNSPYGYGFDTWKADLFDPAKPLLNKTPWLFIRGNHESCQRAGQGWHRFIDNRPWDDNLSCNDPKNDAGSFSEPYAVPLGAKAQIVSFDSANMPSKDMKPEDVSYAIYSKQIAQAEELAKKKSFSIFANHHPISIVLPSKTDSKDDLSLKLNSLGLLMKNIQGETLLSSNFQASLHGHVHTVQAISYENPHPVTIISGNGGSALEELKIKNISLSQEQKKKMKIKEFESYLDFGYATFDRQDKEGLQWLFTEYSQDGNKIFSCAITQNKIQCNR
ncbi:ser/threonine protein phosphatase [Polynucleobacter sp. SHI8]|uniref:metallophosphoesterase family protein n=1 Tax=unclassified Polynucleobacter TaxID=2640945 RepID=UPI002493A966|nr:MULTISPECIES: metallophosphoesterase [unclassified Polynucleobacter]BDW10980.1 ser/threonine protein phosphatase [Polynucleobacter sp. SHI2]BDW13426.1 ser/threonine protein phosphatase [Polynucleobacter sp. SHI8]